MKEELEGEATVARPALGRSGRLQPSGEQALLRAPPQPGAHSDRIQARQIHARSASN